MTPPPQLLHPLDITCAGELQPQVVTGALHRGAVAQHFGAGAQHVGAGEQLDALPQPLLRPARFPNKPACASDAETTITEQTTKLATKNRLIGTSLGKQFSMTRNAGHSRLVLLSPTRGVRELSDYATFDSKTFWEICVI